MCHPILVLPFLQDFDANARVGAGRNRLKNRSHLLRERPVDAAPPVWRIGDVRRAVYRGPAPEQGRCNPRNARARSTLPGSADRVLPPPRESGGSAVSTTSCGVTATQSWRNSELRRSTMRSGRGPLIGSPGGQRDASNPQCEPIRNRVQESARHRRPGSFGSLHRRQTAHPGYV